MLRYVLSYLVAICIYSLCNADSAVSSFSYQVDPVEEDGGLWDKVFLQRARVLLSCGSLSFGHFCSGEVQEIGDMKIKCIDLRTISLSGSEKGTQRFFVLEKNEERRGVILLEYPFSIEPDVEALKNFFEKARRLSFAQNVMFLAADKTLIENLITSYDYYRDAIEKRKIDEQSEIEIEWAREFRSSFLKSHRESLKLARPNEMVAFGIE